MQYCLVLTMGDMSQQQFGKICNIASEYWIDPKGRTGQKRIL